MNTRHLTFLRLVVETGALSTAARAAGVSQPAISQALKALERELGVPLIARLGNRVLPTPAARMLAAQSSRIDITISHLREADPIPLDTPVGVRLGISAGAALMYGPRLVSHWEERNEDAPLRIFNESSQELLLSLEAGDLDLVICPRPRHASCSHLVEQPLFRNQPSIYARKGHPLAHARSLTALRNIGWVVVGKDRSPGGMAEEAFRVRKLPAPRIVAQCPDYLTLMTVIAESSSMGVIPMSRIADSFAGGAIHRLSIVEGLPQYDVCLYRYPGPQAEPIDALEAAILALASELR